VEDMADDVKAVLDHYGVEKAHILGISMGGLIA
jgi:pimeloyl-ACP methyl ester carboxylesterase